MLHPLAVVCALAVSLLSAGSALALSHSDDPWTSYVAPLSACPYGVKVDLTAVQAQQTMSCLVNYARTRRGLSPLPLNARLDRAALMKGQADIRCHIFSHTPCGEPFDRPFFQAGYLRNGEAFWAGENLAWGGGLEGAPDSIIDAWLNSPEHRANIFNSHYRVQGIACLFPADAVSGVSKTTLWVNDFGAITSR